MELLWRSRNIQAHIFFELGKTKTEPESFSYVIEMMGYMPKACLFIDDRIENIDVARSVGIPSIHFLDAKQLRQEFETRQMLPII